MLKTQRPREQYINLDHWGILFSHVRSNIHLKFCPLVSEKMFEHMHAKDRQAGGREGSHEYALTYRHTQTYSHILWVFSRVTEAES